jgi:hypothetical protein
MSNKNTHTKSYELDNFSSEMEQRFQDETARIRDDSQLMSRALEDAQDRKPGVLDAVGKKWLLGAAIVGTAVGLTYVGVGKKTLGEGFRGIFPDNAPAVTNPVQNEQREIDSLQNTGHLTGQP